MKRLLSIISIIVLASALTACGKSIVGNYKLLEIESSNEKISAEDLDELRIKMELVVKDDKNAELILDGESQVLTYDDKEFVSKNLETGESEIMTYKVDGDKIIVDKNGEKLTFQK